MPPHRHHPHDDPPPPHRHGPRHRRAYAMLPLENLLDLGVFPDEEVAEAMYDWLDGGVPEEWPATWYFLAGFQAAVLERLDRIERQLDRSGPERGTA